MFVNSIVQTFFMPNAEEFSELIRTGGLDFALLKPIDTQFLDLAAEDRLVVAREFAGRGWRCWPTRCRGSKGSTLTRVAVPAVSPLRRAGHR